MHALQHIAPGVARGAFRARSRGRARGKGRDGRPARREADLLDEGKTYIRYIASRVHVHQRCAFTVAPRT